MNDRGKIGKNFTKVVIDNLLDTQPTRNSEEKKSASSLVVSLGKVLNGMSLL